MRTRLIAVTRGGLHTAYVAARTCYSEATPYGMSHDTYSYSKMIGLIRQVYKSGHLSIFEHINFTFAIDGISRACSHQLVRHRHCTFSQQSQRYVDMKNPYFTEPEAILNNREADSIYNNFLNVVTETYNKLRDLDIEPEDARAVLPNATETNLVITLNCRELMHICNLRLCSRSQLEIRQMVRSMVRNILEDTEYMWLKPYLVPQCEVDGFCREHKCCGRRPRLDELSQHN